MKIFDLITSPSYIQQQQGWALDAENGHVLRKRLTEKHSELLTACGYTLEKLMSANDINIMGYKVDDPYKYFKINKKYLEIDELPALQTILIYDSEIFNLSITNCENLHRIVANEISLENLSLHNIPKLEILKCPYNHLTSIDLSELNNLVSIHLPYNKISQLTLPIHNNIKFLYIDHNKIDHINFEHLLDLRCLACDYNLLTEIDLSACKKLYQILCSENKITDITTGYLPELDELDITGNPISEIDISKFPRIDYDEFLLWDTNICIISILEHCYNIGGYPYEQIINNLDYKFYERLRDEYHINDIMIKKLVDQKNYKLALQILKPHKKHGFKT